MTAREPATWPINIIEDGRVAGGINMRDGLVHKMQSWRWNREDSDS